jgi:hypothetical protein
MKYKVGGSTGLLFKRFNLFVLGARRSLALGQVGLDATQIVGERCILFTQLFNRVDLFVHLLLGILGVRFTIAFENTELTLKTL